MPEHPKLTALRVRLAEVEALPGLPSEALLGTRALQSSIEARASWIDGHSAVLLGKILHGLVQVARTSTSRPNGQQPETPLAQDRR